MTNAFTSEAQFSRLVFDPIQRELGIAYDLRFSPALSGSPDVTFQRSFVVSLKQRTSDAFNLTWSDHSIESFKGDFDRQIIEASIAVRNDIVSHIKHVLGYALTTRGLVKTSTTLSQHPKADSVSVVCHVSVGISIEPFVGI